MLNPENSGENGFCALVRVCLCSRVSLVIKRNGNLMTATVFFNVTSVFTFHPNISLGANFKVYKTISIAGRTGLQPPQRIFCSKPPPSSLSPSPLPSRIALSSLFLPQEPLLCFAFITKDRLTVSLQLKIRLLITHFQRKLVVKHSRDYIDVTSEAVQGALNSHRSDTGGT